MVVFPTPDGQERIKICEDVLSIKKAKKIIFADYREKE
jgi:hypothetical protein